MFNLDKENMKITYKYFDGRYTQYQAVDVEKIAQHKGIDRYKGDDGWYYLNVKGEWRYFGSIREMNDFINSTLWQK